MRRPDLRILILAAAVLAGLFLLGDAGIGLWAELSWFRSLDYADRFWTLAIYRVAAWAGCFLVAAGGFYALLRYATRSGGTIQIRRRLGDLEIAEAIPARWVRRGTLVLAATLGLLTAGPVADGLAEGILAAVHSEAWGGADPILERDPRFYVFYLPLLRTAWSFLLSWLLWAALAVVGVLFVTGRVVVEESSISVDDAGRRVLTWCGVLFLLLLASHFYLSVFEQVSGGPVGYADVYGDLPIRRLLAILGAAGAVALAVSGRTGRWRLTGGVLVAFAGVWILGLGFYPQLLQRFKVEPNELALERPYIEAKIDATRSAYGLDRIRETGVDVRETDPPSLETVERYTSGLPLWDERPLEATFNQLQGLLAYHRFPDVDNERYRRDGEMEQVAVGVREFAPELLDPSARTWQNLHLRYTHGTGIVSIPVDRVGEGGGPEYFVRDIPPQLSADAPPGLELTDPRVFFGELTTQYAIVDRDTLPAGDSTTAVPLQGLMSRAAFAWALGSKNILLRNVGTGSPRLLWKRDVVNRVRTLAPFFQVDPDPYPVVHQGRVKWVVELYAISNRYPLSEPTSHRGRRLNYLSGVAKAVVDGGSGRTRIYVVQPDDPVLATWRRAFPGLFAPLDEMPAGLQEHLRYPRSLLSTQADLLTAYHMRDAEVFYYRQELWSVGREVYDSRPVTVEPYYLVMPFPGDEESEEEEFLLTVPFTPRDRDNLSAYLIARSDPGHFGELWLFEQANTEQVFGPRQIEVQIDQDSEISQQLSLWRQQGSRAVRGHLLLVPIEGFLLYVEPLFLVAEDEAGAAPGLRRVIAAAGDRVAMAPTLEGALRALLSGMREDVEEPATGEAGAVAGEGPSADRSPAEAEALDRIRELLEEADRALRDGDLSRFGELWRQIRETATEADAGPGPSEEPEDGGGTGEAGGP